MSVYKGARNFGQTSRAPVMEWRWSRATGPSEQIFVCGNYNYLHDTVAPSLMDDYDSIVIRQDGGDMYRLEAAQTGEEITEVFDVHGANLSQSVLINLVMKPQFIAQGVTEADYASIVSRINDEVQKKKSGGQTYSEMASAVSTIGNNTAIAFELMDHLDRHGDQFLQAQYSFQHTLIVPERIYAGGGDFGYVFDNTHRVFSESGMRGAEDVPGLFAIPGAIGRAGDAEWLKQPAHSSMTLYQKRQIVTEYLSADEWARLLYAEAS